MQAAPVRIHFGSFYPDSFIAGISSVAPKLLIGGALFYSRLGESFLVPFIKAGPFYSTYPFNNLDPTFLDGATFTAHMYCGAYLISSMISRRNDQFAEDVTVSYGLGIITPYAVLALAKWYFTS